jgi:hypothetical protein
MLDIILIAGGMSSAFFLVVCVALCRAAARGDAYLHTEASDRDIPIPLGKAVLSLAEGS